MFQVSEKILQKYAELAIKNGVNLQKNQSLLINASILCADFVHKAAETAYKAGARKVIVNWRDDTLNRYAFQYQDKDTLADVDPYRVELCRQAVNEKFALLSVLSDIPGVLKDCDPEKMQVFHSAYDTATEFYDDYLMGNHGQWCVIGIPNEHWAKKVFPDMEEDKALESLWNAVLKTVHIEEDNDAIKDWNSHSDDMHRHCQLLNQYNFRHLHFRSSNGTDLTVGLAQNHVWDGGSCPTSNGVEFNANLPTEEVFTTPAKYHVEGRVVASKPLIHNGQMVDQFWLDFKEGKVTDFNAEIGYDTLKSVVEYDATSCYLGEVALVPYDSPISQSGILFYNTLYDENASCHLALGASYPTCIKNGDSLSKEELEKLEANSSTMHCDFMFGTKDMKVVGTLQDGTEITIMENGNFVI